LLAAPTVPATVTRLLDRKVAALTLHKEALHADRSGNYTTKKGYLAADSAADGETDDRMDTF